MRSLFRLGLGLLLGPALIPASMPGPAAATPEQAKSSASFVNSVGVNVKLGYGDTPYAQFDKVEAVLKRAGIRHIRDGLTADPQVQQRLLALHADGIGATLIVGGDALTPGGGPQTDFYARLRAVAPDVEMLEGPNEADGGFAFDGKTFPQSLIEFQHLLYHTVKSGPDAALPVIAPSIAYPPNSAKVPDLPGDFGNTHSYHGARNPGTTEVNLDLPKFYLDNAAIVSPGETVICTETGNTTAAYPDPSLWMPRITEWAQGRYAVRTYLEYFRDGIPRTFIHELVDEHPDPHHDEQNFGLLRNDWSPKPAYTGIANMIAILQDGDHTAFKLGALDYSLTGDTGAVHHLLLQKSDGTFYLTLWKEVPSYDPNGFQDLGVAGSPVHLTVSPRQVDAAFVYSPLAWPTPGALLRAGADGGMDVTVTDEPIILQMLPAGADLVVTAAGAAAPAAVGQPVMLQAVVKNQGTAPTPPGLTVSVTFFDHTGGAEQMLTYSSTFTGSIAPGQSVTLTADHPWTPTAGGHYQLDALVDDVDRIPETNKDNNRLAFGLDMK